ncbi:DUF6286 domain-containing protein [Actinomycetospora succinea]|uniref:DUF6286 domain-containing protein n=1 Tax=Actinomycetospora succinea TaxID=663603 RepID=UPI00105F97CD|nr:DUF6286 domain-containing protein [Actinomycetospora succinea]
MLVVVCCVQALLGQAPLIRFSQVLEVTAGQRWNSGATIAVAIVLAVLGLVLLLAAIRPGKPTVMPLVRMTDADGAPGADAGVRRTSLSKDLTTTAEGVPGVARATVSARRSRVTATITVAAADPTAVPDTVRGRLEYRLIEVGPAPRPKVRVKARRADTG